MRIRLVILILAFCVELHAQNFIKQLQTKAPNGATVVVREDTKIDELVNNEQGSKNVEPARVSGVNHGTKQNGAPAMERKTAAEQKTVQQGNKETPKENHLSLSKSASLNVDKKHKTVVEHQHLPDSSTNNNKLGNGTEESNNDEDIEIATVDLRKKVMRNSYKVTGFRVQVFAGGNSRQDRQKAERIGNDVKMNFPDQPVYTHFYPPRWICRVGNYRSYAEADRMLNEVKRLGYKQACIVKGKISVSY
jgi:hypothetical protein